MQLEGLEGTWRNAPSPYSG